MDSRKLSALTIAASYIGTVVGAGFASGQEVLQFFTFFGLKSILALALAVSLFIFFGGAVLRLGWQLRAKSYVTVVTTAGGPFLGRVVDAIITFFLFGALSAMAAGAIFAEQFGLPKLLGSALMVVASLVTVLAGFYGVVLSISFVVPVLLLSVFGLSLAALATIPPDLKTIGLWAQEANPVIPFWPAAALAYVSYNLVLAIPILAPSAPQRLAPHRREQRRAPRRPRDRARGAGDQPRHPHRPLRSRPFRNPDGLHRRPLLPHNSKGLRASAPRRDLYDRRCQPLRFHH
ncbi:YkvI family membrane protein [Thermodesulfitimonas sp.]